MKKKPKIRMSCTKQYVFVLYVACCKKNLLKPKVSDQILRPPAGWIQQLLNVCSPFKHLFPVTLKSLQQSFDGRTNKSRILAPSSYLNGMRICVCMCLQNTGINSTGFKHSGMYNKNNWNLFSPKCIYIVHVNISLNRFATTWNEEAH